MKPKHALAIVLAMVLLVPQMSRGQAATSRVIPFNSVPTNVAPGTLAQTFTMQLWDASTAGRQLYCENQTLDVATGPDGVTGVITFNFGAGVAPPTPCPSGPPELKPVDFVSGQSRFLDVVDGTGASVLPNPPGRIPLNAAAFALNPGPQGQQGIQGVPGPQGPPGVVQTVAAGDASISVGGTVADRLVSISPNGVTNAKVSDGALSPAKITGTAATLGPNNFIGDQSVTPGHVLVANAGGAAVDGIGFVGVRGDGGANGFAIVGTVSASGNGVAGQFNGPVNVTGPLSAGANLTMVDSTATVGNIRKGGALFLHNFGTNNTFIGKNAGNLTMTGDSNTATGMSALLNNTTGVSNTASGANALQGNTNGNSNTASGSSALQNNCSSSGPCTFPNAGSNNTASGFKALQSNTTGRDNTASGMNALLNNITGSFNTGIGVGALASNNFGFSNTAIGWGALANKTTGGGNIAIGVSAAGHVTTGSNNIEIGFTGALFPDESSTIRIGEVGTHTRFIVAGVDTAVVTGGVPVLISSGQLGVAASSRRFKEEIRDMGEATNRLRRLRPVTFYYKQAQAGGPRRLQYGLIAEEVAAVYPELVEYSEKGEPFTVRYQLLAPMLLNEVQRQDREIERQRQQIYEQAAQITELKARAAQITDLQAQLAAISARLKRLDRQELAAAAIAGPRSTH